MITTAKRRIVKYTKSIERRCINILHTITITQQIFNKDLYEKLYETLKKNSTNNNYKFYPTNSNKTEYTTCYLKNIGFHKITLKKFNIKKQYKEPFRSISIQLNPIRLIEKHDNTRLTTENDIEEISIKFNEIIKGINPLLNDFYKWNTERIDYTVDLKVDNVSTYIKLFQRADKPYNFKEHYVEGANERKQQEGSFYLESKSLNVNFYDKEYQQRKEGYSDADIINAKDKLRFEVQVKKAKVYNLKYSNEFKTRELYNYLKVDIARDLILDYYYKTIGHGNYYKLDKAIKIIDNSDYTVRCKNKLKDILRLINKCRSVWKARQEFIKGAKLKNNNKMLKGSKQTFNRQLKLLRELEPSVNPVTIPEKWTSNDLDNLFSKLIKQLDSEVFSEE